MEDLLDIRDNSLFKTNQISGKYWL